MLLIKQLTPLSPYHQSRQQSMGYVGIGKIEFHSQWESQQSMIQTIQDIQNIHDNVFIQIFNSDSLISPKHLYYASYFAEQAFSLSSNISKSKSMEYLIYASVQRQIKNAIETVGLPFDNENSHPNQANIVICADEKKKITSIVSPLMNALNSKMTEDTYPTLAPHRILRLQNLYQIGDFELENAILSLGHPLDTSITDLPEERKSQIFLHVMVEKMAQLFMENFKHKN